MRDLGTLGGPDSNAWIINDRGQVAGQSFTSFTANSNGVPTVDPFFWEDGKMTDIGSLGGTYGFAAWLNNRGQVVGDSNLAGDTTQEPFLWSAATGIRNLGSLGGNFGFANSINEDGEVVGLTSTPQALVGFLWKDGVMTNLGTIGSDFGSEAYSINSKGQIVGGTFPFGGGDLRGFLWENGGPMVDLNTLLVQPTTMYVNGALIINDRGEIGCLGKNPGDTTTHACVLIPCDNNHSGVEGCEDADTTSVTPSNPLAVTQTSTDASQSTLSPEMLAARARIGGRYHTLGVPH
jgi:probable HAF family extracellular repeat protein